MTIRNKTFSAVRWTATATIFNSALRILQVAVLARLLAPSDFGLMATVGVVLGFAALFADFGVNSAFVQRKDVTSEQRSSLFWFNVAIGAALFMFVATISPLISLFFDDKRLTLLVIVSSLSFIISAFGSQLIAAAQKRLAFAAVSVVEISSAGLNFVASIAGALYGLGVYSLVFGGLVSALAATTLVWVLESKNWRPLARFRLTEVRPFLGFGLAVMVNNCVNQVNTSIDLLLAGRWLNASQLGLYSVPRNLALQVQFAVNPVITRVGFPLIAEFQSDIAKVRSIYLKTMNLTASINAPIYLFIAAYSQELIQILLGQNWNQSSSVLMILSLWGAIRSTSNPVGSLLLGMGRADMALKWNIAILILYPPLLFFGLSYGIEGLASAMLAAVVITFIPCWYFLVRKISSVCLQEYTSAVFRPFFTAIIAVLLSCPLTRLIEHVAAKVLIGFLTCAFFYLMLSVFLNKNFIHSVYDLFGIQRNLDQNKYNFR